MADNCVNYGSHSGSSDKLRLRMGNPDRVVYNKSYRLLNESDCITCNVKVITTGSTMQCKDCIARKKLRI